MSDETNVEPAIDDKEAFDPSRYLTKLSGKDYLEVRWRLVWLRKRHPDAKLRTHLHVLDEAWVTSNDGGKQVPRAIFHAQIDIPGGGCSEGWGSETQNDFKDFIEKAETKAIGRALAALGFGTQFSAHEFGGEGDANRPVDSPTNPPPTNRPAAPPRGPSPVPRGPSPVPRRPTTINAGPEMGQPRPIQPPIDGSVKPAGKISSRQRQYIEDLLVKMGESTEQFSSVLDAMDFDTASEWIKQLNDGAQPWVTAAAATNGKVVPHPAVAQHQPAAQPVQGLEMSEAMIRKVLKMTEPIDEQKADWIIWIEKAGDDIEKWKNLARQARNAVKFARKPEQQAWRYKMLVEHAPYKNVLDGLYKMANEDVVYNPDIEAAIETRLVEIVDAEATAPTS